MTVLNIITYPDQFLRKKAKPVTDIDGRIQKLIDDMAGTMFSAPGVGLAAIQVGIDRQLIIFDAKPGQEERELKVLINPKIIAAEGVLVSENEGCLSLPDFRSDVKRAASVLVEGYDRHGKPLRIEANGFQAVILQHEIDHLSGTLFLDHVSSLKRELYKRRVKKMLKKR